MQHFQTSFFYDLQELIRNSSLLRKYYYLFKALDLSALPDRNHGIAATKENNLKNPNRNTNNKTETPVRNPAAKMS